MIKHCLAIISVGFIFIAIISSCGTEAPRAWPWWTHADSIAVNQELASWRDTLNGNNLIRGQNNTSLSYPLDLNVPIVTSDTVPRSVFVDSIVKIAHFFGHSNVMSDSTHLDDLLFEVKNDTMELNKDTFCYITYTDSSRYCIAILQYDSLWIIKFRPDTTYDTTVAPIETIITYRKLSVTKTGFTAGQEEQNIYSLVTMRKLELKKDSAATVYRLKYLTGFGTYVPNTTLAPTISYIVLSKPGRSDTFRYSPRTDRKGLYNLNNKDSLYSLAVNESVTVYILTTTPTDTLTDWNYFFVSCASPFVSQKTNVTVSARTGRGNIAFSQAGLGHIYVEVFPASTLFYPYTEWTSTYWALPVRVVP